MKLQSRLKQLQKIMDEQVQVKRKSIMRVEFACGGFVEHEIDGPEDLTVVFNIPRGHAV